MTRNAGFTLLEMLVSLAILGLVLAGLSQGTRYGLWTWDRQAALIDSRDQLDAADRALRRLIQSMTLGGEPAVTAPDGQADRFAFTALLPMGDDPVPRWADMALMVGGGHRLILQWREHRHETRFAPPPPMTETELLSGVERISFRYWYPGDRRGTPAGWRTDWHEPTPPLLVRIHLDFVAGDPRRWPDIVADCDRDQFVR